MTVKHYLLLTFFLVLTGCCGIAELSSIQKIDVENKDSTLYRFRLERSSVTKFSGLLALKPNEEGMWSVLLDATGVPLLKEQVRPDGSMQVEYCAAAICDTKFPELLGKLVEYIYFTPVNADCPWYAFSCVCAENESSRQSITWRKMGPFRLWEVERLSSGENEKTTVKMNISSVIVQLNRINETTGN